MDLFGKTLFFYHRVRYWFRDLAGAEWGSSSLQHSSTNWLANERPRIKFPGKGGKACENMSAGAGKAARGKPLFSGLGKFLMASYALPVYA